MASPNSITQIAAPSTTGAAIPQEDFEITQSDDEAMSSLITEGLESSRNRDSTGSPTTDTSGPDTNTWNIEPPPQAIYLSKLAARDACNTWARQYGYALVVGKKQKKSKVTKQVYLQHFQCSRHKPPKSQVHSEDHRPKRNRATKKIGCPMHVVLVADDPQNPQGQWRVRYSASNTRRERLHNHPPDDVMSLALHRRKFREKYIQTIKDLVTSGVEISKIMAVISKQCDENDALIIRRDIDNEINQLKLDTAVREGPPIDQLLAALVQDGYVWRHRLNQETGRIEYILFLHPEQLKCLTKHPEVLHFDCTYSTNKYKLPVLDICGVTAQNTTIQVGIALMSGEKKEHYKEVFQDLQIIFER
jgi:hypothetical protein